MKYALASIVLVPRGQWGPPPSRERWLDVLRWAARAGFGGIELNPRWLDFHRMSEAELDRFREDTQAQGLCVSGLCVSRCILTRTPQAQEHRERLERAVLVAERLGAPLLTLSLSMPTLPGPGRPILRGRDVPAEEFVRSAEIVRRLAGQAGGRGVGLSVEMHDDGLLDTPEACLEFLARLGDAGVGVNPDLGNFCRTAEEPPDWEGALRLLAPRANCWHVKNYRAGEPAPLWDGDIDYARAVEIMRAAGFRDWVSVESYSPDVLPLQERSLRYLQQLARS